MMIAKLAPTPVDPRSAGRDFWKRYHAYRRVRQMESRPDDPIRPDDIEEQQLRRDDPFQIHHRYEIVRDGVMLSWFTSGTAKPDAPGYESNKHLFYADWFVDPGHRRHRIGASWLPLVLELMDRHACTVLGVGTEEDSGHAFLKWVGAEKKFTGAENRLKLADVDWVMAQRWIKDGMTRSPQTRMEIYDGPMPDEMLEDFAPQFTYMLRHAPMEDLDHGDEVMTPDSVRDWNERLAMSGERPHLILAREPDGIISAMTDTVWAPYRPTIIHQNFTGVRPESQGRGLGKWVKAAMLLHLRELYPDAQWVTTDNAGSNAPMLAINTKLGFKQYRVGSEYQIGRDALAAKVKSL